MRVGVPGQVLGLHRGRGRLTLFGRLRGGELLRLLARGLLLGRYDGHGLLLRKGVEVPAEIDGDVGDVHAEQVVHLVLEHERRQELVGDAGHRRVRAHALDLVVGKDVAFHERVDEVDALLGVHGEQLHEARALGLLLGRERRQLFDGKRGELDFQRHASRPLSLSLQGFRLLLQDAEGLHHRVDDGLGAHGAAGRVHVHGYGLVHAADHVVAVVEDAA